MWPWHLWPSDKPSQLGLCSRPSKAHAQASPAHLAKFHSSLLASYPGSPPALSLASVPGKPPRPLHTWLAPIRLLLGPQLPSQSVPEVRDSVTCTPCPQAQVQQATEPLGTVPDSNLTHVALLHTQGVRGVPATAHQGSLTVPSHSGGAACEGLPAPGLLNALFKERDATHRRSWQPRALLTRPSPAWGQLRQEEETPARCRPSPSLEHMAVARDTQLEETHVLLKTSFHYDLNEVVRTVCPYMILIDCFNLCIPTHPFFKFHRHLLTKSGLLPWVSCGVKSVKRTMEGALTNSLARPYFPGFLWWLVLCQCLQAGITGSEG